VRRPPRLPALALLLVLSAPFLFVKLGMPFLDPDEGLYATIALEMASDGDWVMPHANGLPYLEKPPLYFWLTALTFRLLGPSEWATRVWSALSLLGTVLLTWRIGRRLHGDGAGLLAGIAMATMVGNALYVRKASADQLFVFCLTLAIYGFLRDAERADRGSRRFLLFYLGVALSLLAKGFIGLFAPLIVGLAVALMRRLPWRGLNLARGAALVALVAGPWHVLAAWRSPTLFGVYVLDAHLLRFFDARRYVEADVPLSTLGFLAASFVWAFPWSTFTLARSGPARTPGAHWRPIIVLWLVVVVSAFALSRFKHEYYALPALPALAVLAGAAWAGGRDIGRWLAIGLVGCAAVGVGALWIGAAPTAGQVLNGLAELNAYYRILRDQKIALPFQPGQFGVLLQGLGWILLVGWLVAAVCWARGLRRTAFASLVGVAAAITLLIFRLLDVVEPHHSVKEVAQVINAQAAPGDVLVLEGSLSYAGALPFYTRRRVLLVNGAVDYFAITARLPEAQVVFISITKLHQLWDGPQRVFLVARRPFNPGLVAALPSAAVHDLGAHGGSRLYSNR
jgi:4-amino-4-deoxy-L-arabinose transferase-like glycosyltransferase